jgi:hypothetical protein
MIKKIIFESRDRFYFENSPRPEPAVKNLPKWWKDIPKYAEFEEFPEQSVVTVKQCAPTIDVFSSGYIIKLWEDLVVEKKEDGRQEIFWNSDFEAPMVGPWDRKQSSNFEIPEGYNPNILKYNHGWIIKTPKNWSTLFIHPTAYQNLPIKAIAGIVDTDILKTDINCPFVIKEDFEGIIPKGTPIVQLIPFKRSEWKSVFKDSPPEKLAKEQEKLLSVLYGYYSSRRVRKVYK